MTNSFISGVSLHNQSYLRFLVLYQSFLLQYETMHKQHNSKAKSTSAKMISGDIYCSQVRTMKNGLKNNFAFAQKS